MSEVERQAQQWIDESPYLKMKDLGLRLGVTSHTVGRFLTEAGLRFDQKPTARAYSEGYAKIEMCGEWPQYKWNERRIVSWMRDKLQKQVHNQE